MMTYEGLEKENMILYSALAKQTKKLDEIKSLLNNINLFDSSYKEMYDYLSYISQIVEDKKRK